MEIRSKKNKTDLVGAIGVTTRFSEVVKAQWGLDWAAAKVSRQQVPRGHVIILNKLNPASTLTPSGLQVAAETLRFQGSQCHSSRMANILYRQESGLM